jgi:chromosome segregation ATPase
MHIKHELVLELKKEKTQTKTLSADVNKARIALNATLLVDEELAQTRTQLDELQKGSQAIINQQQAKVDDMGNSLEIAKKKMLEYQKEKRLVDEELARTKIQMDVLQKEKRQADEDCDKLRSQLDSSVSMAEKMRTENENTVANLEEIIRMKEKDILDLEGQVKVLYFRSNIFFALFSIENGFPSCYNELCIPRVSRDC